MLPAIGESSKQLFFRKAPTMHSPAPNAMAAAHDDCCDDTAAGLSLTTYTSWLEEIRQQPAWRARADREADYYDGNQLDSAVLRRQREIGMPPAIEPLIGPTIDAVLGMEAKTRTDFRVLPDGDRSGDEVAEACNYKLNRAERHSRADAACSEAYASQVKVGLGWVEVSRESDPFRYPYRCRAVHRNEIFWDCLANQDQSDARYLVRQRWMDVDQAALFFPEQAELVRHAGNGWGRIDPSSLSMDGGTQTDLAMAWDQERGWSIEEQQWRDVSNRRVCLREVWYRIWERVLVLKSPDGRVVEYKASNPAHQAAVAQGLIAPQWSIVGRVRLAWWLGPHRLSDTSSPYRHNKFPYVPFWGKREDRTGVPYGLVRGMMYLQDEVNARISKMQWGLASVRTTRTDGAVLDDDEVFRQEIARPDADIVLDAQHMAQPGATFKVERDFQLNEQQYKRLVDAREGIKRTGGIYNSFMGQDGQASSGVAISSLVEQSNQTLADVNDNFKDARQDVGDLLLSLIIEDMAGREESVLIDGMGIKDDKSIVLNSRAVDPDTGIEYLSNDIERTKLKVTLSDVPSTPSFRAQQLAAMSEAFKSAPPEYQKIMMPHLFALMDVPNKQDIIEAIKGIDDTPTPESIQQRIDQAVSEALTKARMDIEMRKLSQQQPLIDAQVRKLISDSVAAGIDGMYSATQAAANIATQPAVAPLADTLLRSAGFQDADAAPIVPTLPGPVPGVEPPPLSTSPAFPARPESADVGMMEGAESAR